MKRVAYLILTLVLLINTSCKEHEDDDLGGLLDFGPSRFDAFDYSEDEIARDDRLLQDYLDRNKITTIKTESGLHYRFIKEGEGRSIENGDTVIAHYISFNLTTGEEFDKSDRTDNPYGNILRTGQLIEGVQEGLLLASEGSTIQVFMPSYLAFGKTDFFQNAANPFDLIDYTFEVNLVLKR